MKQQQDKYDILKTYYGYDTFRDGQEELIDCLLNGQDVCGIMPTGAGKSVCYQVPALLLPHVTLVVSRKQQRTAGDRRQRSPRRKRGRSRSIHVFQADMNKLCIFARILKEN